MDFNNKFTKQWQNTGTEPSDSYFASSGGFKAKLKPPAQWFNWFWSKVIATITELQTKLSTVDTNKANKTLDNVDNATLKTKIENSGYVGGATNIKNGTASGSLYGINNTRAETTQSGQTYMLGTNSVAFGDEAYARGNNAFAVGCGYANGNYSFSEGGGGASGYCSHAEGGSTIASGSCSHAEGSNTTASGYCSHAEGKHCRATQEGSHAEGIYTLATGSGGHAEGFYTVARSNQHVQGKYNIEDTDGKYAHIVGNGTGDPDTLERVTDSCSNAHTLDWDGNAWFAGDVSTGVNALSLSTAAYVKIATSVSSTTPKTYATNFPSFSPDDCVVLRIKDNGTAGVLTVSGTTEYAYTQTSNVKVAFKANGQIIVTSTSTSSTSYTINAEFLIITKNNLTLTEVTS